LIRQRQELEPEEAWAKKKEGNLKRLISTLKLLKNEIEDSKLLPLSIVRDIKHLIDKIEIENK
jgi:hypothetical protein